MERIEERTATRIGERGNQKAPAPPTSCVGTLLTQSDFPLTVANDTSYCLAEDVVVNAGTAITATSASNVSIDLNGFTLTFSNSGFGELLSAVGANNIVIHGDTSGGTLQHGGYRPTSGTILQFVDFNSATNCQIRNLNINVFGIGSLSRFIEGGGATNSLNNNTINIGGWNQFSLLRLSGCVGHDNIINVNSFNTANYVTYSRIFERCGDTYNNVIDVSADSVAAQLWGGWGSNHSQYVHHNTVHYRPNTGASCRVFLMDSGANGWIIEDNKIFVYAVASPTYVFRQRSSGSFDSFNNTVRYNTVDTTGVTEPAGSLNIFAIGDNLNTRDNNYHNNLIVGRGNHIQHYGGSAANNAFFCNDFQHQNSGYALYMNNAFCSSVDWTFSHNRFSTDRGDGCMSYKNCSGGALSMCENVGFTSIGQVCNDQTGFTFSSSPCADGSANCWSAAGARW